MSFRIHNPDFNNNLVWCEKALRAFNIFLLSENKEFIKMLPK